MKKWEYETQSLPLRLARSDWVRLLNNLGGQGWELVAVTSPTDGNLNSVEQPGNHCPIAFFKREEK